MNMDTMPMTVYIKYTIGYQKNATAANSRSVTPFFADVTGCGNSVFNVPGNGGMGSVYTKARSWTAPWDGDHGLRRRSPPRRRHRPHAEGPGERLAVRDDRALRHADGPDVRDARPTWG